VNALRAHLAEFGIIAPQGLRHSGSRPLCCCTVGAHQRSETVGPAPEVHRLGGHQHPNAGWNRNHAAATFTARSTVAKVPASVPGGVRMVALPITISIIADPLSWAGARAPACAAALPP
jgi:hypothetical protein